MFKLVFLNAMKLLIKNKVIIFWMLVFPIVLTTLFYAAFSNLNTAEAFKMIKVAVVYQQPDADFSAAIGQADSLFEVREMTSETAQAAVKNKEVACVIVASQDGFTLQSIGGGIEPSIVKSFVDSYLFVRASAGDMMGAGAADLHRVIADLTDKYSEFGSNAVNGRNTDITVIYYYAVLGLVCFYFAIAGKNIMDITQPCHTLAGRRVNVSSCSRLNVFAATALAHLVIVAGIVLLIFGYMALVLGVGFGAKWGLVLLSLLLGALVGLSFGMMVGTIKGDGIKIAIIISVTMLLSVLAGMCSPELKYMVLKGFPAAQFLNPVGLISDCLYALYYYTSLASYWLYFGILCAYLAVFVIATLLLIKRRGYGRI